MPMSDERTLRLMSGFADDLNALIREHIPGWLEQAEATVRTAYPKYPGAWNSVARQLVGQKIFDTWLTYLTALAQPRPSLHAPTLENTKG